MLINNILKKETLFGYTSKDPKELLKSQESVLNMINDKSLNRSFEAFFYRLNGITKGNNHILYFPFNDKITFETLKDTFKLGDYYVPGHTCYDPDRYNYINKIHI